MADEPAPFDPPIQLEYSRLASFNQLDTIRGILCSRDGASLGVLVDKRAEPPTEPRVFLFFRVSATTQTGVVSDSEGIRIDTADLSRGGSKPRVWLDGIAPETCADFVINLEVPRTNQYLASKNYFKAIIPEADGVVRTFNPLSFPGRGRDPSFALCATDVNARWWKRETTATSFLPLEWPPPREFRGLTTIHDRDVPSGPSSGLEFVYVRDIVALAPDPGGVLFFSHRNNELWCGREPNHIGASASGIYASSDSDALTKAAGRTAPS